MQKIKPKGECCAVVCEEEAEMSISAVVPLRNGQFAVGSAHPCREHALSAAADVVDMAIEVLQNGFESVERRGVPEEEDE